MTTTRNGGDGSHSGETPAPDPAKSPGKSILEYVTAVGGFTAVLSALLLYFGYARTAALYGYFGVPIGVLDFSTMDYLLRSAEVIFRPTIWATAGLAALVGFIYAFRWVESRGLRNVLPWVESRGMRNVLRWVESRGLRNVLRCALAVIALIGAIIALAGSFGKIPAFWAALLLAVSGGCVIIAYELTREEKPLNPPVGALAIGILLIVGAAFWSMNLYAYQVGVKTADCYARNSCALPEAVIYSKDYMALPGGQQQPGKQRPPWGYVFGGGGGKGVFKVLAYANYRWLLLPFSWDSTAKQWKWDRKQHTAILPDDDKNVLVRVLAPAAPAYQR
jgi:hypothetical protein